MLRVILIFGATAPLIVSCGPELESKLEPSTALAITTEQASQPDSNLKPWLSTDNRYELRIPKHWHLSTSAEDTDRATAVESATGNSAGVASRKNLLNIRNSKEDHFAVFQLTKYPLEGIDQQLISRMTESDLQLIDREVRQGMQRIQGNAGFTIVSWDSASFTRVNSMRAWTVGYRFIPDGSSTEWQTSIVSVPINGEIIEMSSTYVLSKSTLAKPVLTSIVNSFKIRP